MKHFLKYYKIIFWQILYQQTIAKSTLLQF